MTHARTSARTEHSHTKASRGPMSHPVVVHNDVCPTTPKLIFPQCSEENLFIQRLLCRLQLAHLVAGPIEIPDLNDGTHQLLQEFLHPATTQRGYRWGEGPVGTLWRAKRSGERQRKRERGGGTEWRTSGNSRGRAAGEYSLMQRLASVKQS